MVSIIAFVGTDEASNLPRRMVWPWKSTFSFKNTHLFNLKVPSLICAVV